MKVIFLDVDGVLCTMRSLCLAMARWHGTPLDKDLYWDDIVIDSRVEEAQTERRENEQSVPNMNNENWPFDIIAVDLIHSIVRDHPEVKFVISSTWREKETIESLQQMFALKGLFLPIFDFTEVPEPEDYISRSHEIKNWLDLNKDVYNVTNFCIIDDNSIAIGREFPNNFVQTLFDNGFTQVEYERVMKILEIKNG
jgi:hypothetical protein